MTPSDKKKTGILAVLLVIAGISWYSMYQPAAGPEPGAPPKAASKAPAQKINQDAQIRLEIVGKTSSSDVGRKNLFQYGQKPAPKPVEPPRGFTPAPTPIVSVIQTSGPPSPPPPPPFRAFRYEGFSVSKGGGRMLGSITEGGSTYEVREGECVMGQYCVTRLTEGLIELEDLQTKQRRSFTRIQQ